MSTGPVPNDVKPALAAGDASVPTEQLASLSLSQDPISPRPDAGVATGNAIAEATSSTSYTSQTSSTTPSYSTNATPDLATKLQKQNVELTNMLRVLHDESRQTRADLTEVETRSTQLITSLQSEIRRLQDERASLRTSLQAPEYEGSEKMLARFMALNRAIEDWCTGASEEIIASVVNARDPDQEPTTLDIVDLQAFKACARQTDACDLMYRAEGAEGRPRSLELVTDFALRSILCYHLLECVFDRFHPILGLGRDPSMRPLKRSNLDRPMRDMYGNVRLAEPQAVSGRWRTNSFKAIAASPDASAHANDLIPNITQLFLHDVRRLMEAIHGRKLHGQILHEPTVVEAAEVIKLAYDWNADVKSKDVLIEYHPFGARNGGTFRPERMDFMEQPTSGGAASASASASVAATSPKDVKVLCGTTLGLETSKAPGGGRPPIYVLHAKAKVATHHFFDAL